MVWGGFIGTNTLVLIALLSLVAWALLRGSLGGVDDQSLMSFFPILPRYRHVDFEAFMKYHNEAFLTGEKTGNYVPGVCNYYELMSDLITLTSGPFWHFVPMTKGLTRKECHNKFHHTIVEYLAAVADDKILEFGCGFGEIGRQVSKITGASVTGLTMSDMEIVGGIERIQQAGLQNRCTIVQGDYHHMPFDSCSFDKVFGIYTLKYSSDLTTAIAEAARVLKPGGRLLTYEIVVNDKYEPGNPTHEQFMRN